MQNNPDPNANIETPRRKSGKVSYVTVRGGLGGFLYNTIPNNLPKLDFVTMYLCKYRPKRNRFAEAVIQKINCFQQHVINRGESSVLQPQTTYRGGVEIGGVYLPSQLERIS